MDLTDLFPGLYNGSLIFGKGMADNVRLGHVGVVSRSKFCSGLHQLHCCRRPLASRMAFASRPSAITASSWRRANPLGWICTGRCNIQWRMTSLCLSTFWMATASQLRE